MQIQEIAAVNDRISLSFATIMWNYCSRPSFWVYRLICWSIICKITLLVNFFIPPVCYFWKKHISFPTLLQNKIIHNLHEKYENNLVVILASFLQVCFRTTEISLVSLQSTLSKWKMHVSLRKIKLNKLVYIL